MNAMSAAVSEPSFAVHVDCDNLWIYENEFGFPRSDDQDLIYTRALPTLAEAFGRWGAKATFFVIGSELVRPSCRAFCRDALAAGHRIASHGHSHRVDFARLGPDQLRQEIVDADRAIGEALGCKAIGFRSPGYAADPAIHAALIDCGYRYDSSVLPGPGGLLMKAYMMLAGQGRNGKSFGPLSALLARSRPYRLTARGAPDLWEFPIATFPGLRLPIHSTFAYRLGDGYLRTALRLLCRSPGHHVYLLHAIDGLDDPVADRFRGQVPALAVPFQERMAFLARLGERLHGRVRLTEDLVAPPAANAARVAGA